VSTRLSPGARLDRTVEILKTVAHPLRLRIVAVLCEGDEHVSGLAARLGLSATTVSQSLSHLRRQRIVAVERRSRHATYTVAERALRDLIAWAEGRSDTERLRHDSRA
jgi:ArsR family transcriptional regulator